MREIAARGGKKDGPARAKNMTAARALEGGAGAMAEGEEGEADEVECWNKRIS